MVKGHGTSSLKFSQLLLCLSIKCKIALKSPKPVNFRRAYSGLNARRVPKGAENQQGQELSKIWSLAPRRPRSFLPPPPSTRGRKESDSKSRSLPASAFLPFAQLPLPQFPRQRLWPRPTPGLPRPSFPP